MINDIVNITKILDGEIDHMIALTLTLHIHSSKFSVSTHSILTLTLTKIEAC
jgi:hypothetical protein